MAASVSENEFVFSRNINNLNVFPKDAIVICGLVKQVYARENALRIVESTGLDVIIVTNERDVPSGILDNGLFVLSIFEFYKETLCGKLLRRVFTTVEVSVARFLRPLDFERMSEGFGNQNATLSVYLFFASRKIIKSINPKYIVAHQAVRYGFIAAMNNSKSFIFPYGQDIYSFGRSNYFIEKLLIFAFKKVKGVILGSSSAKNYLTEYYGVLSDKCFVYDYIPESSFFNKISDQKKLRVKYGLDFDSFIVVDIRRFAKGWGAESICEAFLNLASSDDNFIFILMSGGFDPDNKFLLERIEKSNYRSKFLIFEESVSIEQYSELLSLSDLGLSIMETGEMRSGSILNAAAIGLPMLMNFDSEFFNLSEYGFKASYLSSISSENIENRIYQLRSDRDSLLAMSESSMGYIRYASKHGVSLEVLYGDIFR